MKPGKWVGRENLENRRTKLGSEGPKVIIPQTGKKEEKNIGVGEEKDKREKKENQTSVRSYPQKEGLYYSKPWDQRGKT